MRVFKFGGASVKDASGVLNLVKILKSQKTTTNLVVVVSAMGKTTNALEVLLKNYWEKADYQANINALKNYHYEVVKPIFPQTTNKIYQIIDNTLTELTQTLTNLIPDTNFDKVYDQIVAFGELISTQIVHYTISQHNLPCHWLDARSVIRTDQIFREGRVDWEFTEKAIQEKVKPLINSQIIVTQGFIGSTNLGETTTLGREGSDFTGAIFAACLKAENLTIWKDVAGVLNADPKKFPSASLFNHLSYREASEMTYYGASVIHPKTIAPLQRADIQLFVKSFLEPEKTGTCISAQKTAQHLASIILKEQQILLNFEVRKFNYLREEEVAEVLEACAEVNLKVNLIHKSAFQLRICTDNRPERIERIEKKLQEIFQISYKNDCTLITLINADNPTAQRILFDKQIILEEKSGNLYQIVVQS